MLANVLHVHGPTWLKCVFDTACRMHEKETQTSQISCNTWPYFASALSQCLNDVWMDAQRSLSLFRRTNKIFVETRYQKIDITKLEAEGGAWTGRRDREERRSIRFSRGERERSGLRRPPSIQWEQAACVCKFKDEDLSAIADPFLLVLPFNVTRHYYDSTRDPLQMNYQEEAGFVFPLQIVSTSKKIRNRTPRHRM